MILTILLATIFLCTIVLGVALKKALNNGEDNAKTANEMRYQNSRAIIENKDVFSKNEIQKAQQFIDSYLEKRL